MAKKGEVKYTDLFAADVHYGLLELEADFKKLDLIAQSFSKTITGTKARINITIKEQTQALRENKAALNGVDVAAGGARETLDKLGESIQETSQKSKALKQQQDGLNEVFDITKASVDQIKARITSLTKEYNALGRATDQEKRKSRELATEISHCKTEVDQMTAAIKKGKVALDVADGSYSQASRRLAELRKNLRELPDAINKNTGAWNKANPQVRQHLTEIEKLDRAVKRLDATMGVHGRNVGNYQGSIKGAASSVAGWAAAYLSASEALRFSFDQSLRFDSTRTALGSILGDTDTADRKMEDLRKTAGTLGLQYQTLTSAYKSFTGATINSNMSLEESDRIFNAVSRAAAHYKLSNEELEGALRAIQQMVSKGTVQSEELRGQLAERLPSAYATAAKAMGLTTMEMAKMLEKGEILAVDLLPKLAGELEKLSIPADGLQKSWNKLITTFSTGLGDDSRITSMFGWLVNGIERVSDTIFKTVNSTGWNEFFARLTSNQTADIIRDLNKSFSTGTSAIKRSFSFDVKEATGAEVKMEYNNVAAAYKNATEALNAYKKAIQGKELGAGGYTEMDDYKNIQKYTQMLDALGAKMGQLSIFLPKASKTTEQSLTSVSDSALTSISAIQKRISDLKKIDGSSIAGSDLDVRIKNLQARLKELNGTTRDVGSALDKLRTRISSIRDAFQLQALAAVQAGKSFAPDQKSLDLLDKLQEQLEFVETLGRGKPIEIKIKSEVVDSNPTGGLSTSASNPAAIVPISYSSAEQRERTRAELNANIQDAVDVLRENSWVISDVFGYEMGNMFDHMADNLENFLTGAGNDFEDWARTAASAIGAIDEQLAAASERRVESYEREKDYKIKLAGDNKEAVLAIEAEADKKISDEKKKQARTSKTAAMFEIAINTAVAASKVLGQTGIFGLPLVPIIIGMGAAQLALVAAQPLPQFFKGTDNAPRGFAEVAERGPELIVSRSGKKQLVRDHSIMHLEGGEQIYNTPDTMKQLEMMRFENASEAHRGMAAKVKDSIREDKMIMLEMNEHRIGKIVGEEVGKQIKEIPINNLNIDENGFTRSLRKGNTTVTTLNTKYRLK